jgi:hypothetical protein
MTTFFLILTIYKVRLHLHFSLLLSEFHCLFLRVLVPDLDGPVSESAQDGIASDLDVVDLGRALESRLSVRGAQAVVPTET